jgi:hypothetical protein
MAENYVYVLGQDGETYEICPTDGLLSFLQRLAEDEAAEQQTAIEHVSEHKANAEQRAYGHN